MSIATTRHSVDEYFERELSLEARHEYADGEILEMVGGSLPHNDISGNLFFLLKSRFSKPDFQILFGNTRVQVPEPVAYFYPDAAIIRGEPECELNRPDTVLNPVVVFEVLSPSTERFDRGRKLELYQTIESLEYCVLIEQKVAKVELISRVAPGHWKRERFGDLLDTVTLASLNWSFSLAQLYQDVDLGSAEVS